MITYTSLKTICTETIHKAFIEAFADYAEPVSLTCKQLEYLLARRGFSSELSFGAFEQERLIGFILNGTGSWNGLKTAYDTGTGVIKPWRKQGIASTIFEQSLPVLQQHGIQTYLLEVLKNNTKAITLYKKMGFSITREFHYFTAPKDAVDTRFPESYDQSRISLKPLTPELCNTVSASNFHDFSPSWQNSFQSITRVSKNFSYIGAYVQNTFAGYGIIENNSGDIPQIAVAEAYRRQYVGTKLLQALLTCTISPTVKIINTDAAFSSITEFCLKKGFTQGIGQFEMDLQLI